MLSDSTVLNPLNLYTCILNDFFFLISFWIICTIVTLNDSYFQLKIIPAVFEQQSFVHFLVEWLKQNKNLTQRNVAWQLSFSFLNNSHVAKTKMYKKIEIIWIKRIVFYKFWASIFHQTKTINKTNGLFYRFFVPHNFLSKAIYICMYMTGFCNMNHVVVFDAHTRSTFLYKFELFFNNTLLFIFISDVMHAYT